MTVKDLQSVLCGTVTLYEEIPRTDRDRPPRPGEWYRDLYTGMSREIPEEFTRREVLLARPGTGNQSGSIEIQLKSEAWNDDRRIKKEHEKDPLQRFRGTAC